MLALSCPQFDPFRKSATTKDISFDSPPCVFQLSSSDSYTAAFVAVPAAEVAPAMSGDAPWAAHGRGDARAPCPRVLPATEPVFRETLLRQITAGAESL